MLVGSRSASLAELMRSAADGSLHGTTRDGGSSGPGTVFRLDAAGTLTTLHSFAISKRIPAIRKCP